MINVGVFESHPVASQSLCRRYDPPCSAVLSRRWRVSASMSISQPGPPVYVPGAEECVELAWMGERTHARDPQRENIRVDQGGMVDPAAWSWHQAEVSAVMVRMFRAC
ncbi:hypothetical protein Ari01nite_39110 [Paractinoplanes rishiriensis]|uniref:Uncharacterized protein n=1 Tax=Paractinoplanes rishiriensis TaxID=1050105 RepID=A0A919K4G7_9ACTN|nr:hypothetical protein Ari01nite_39110 [Actinoplanes rishiriensis]